MIRILTVVAGLMVVACITAQAPTEPLLPKTAPPVFRIVYKVDANKQIIQFMVTEFVPQVMTVTVPVTKSIGGRLVTVTETQKITKLVLVTKLVDESMQGMTFTTSAGGPVPMRDIGRLMTGKVIAMAADTTGIDPLYRKALSADTIIVIPGKAIPMGQVPAVPIPIPVPAPVK